jgi:cytidyltransferase-like protein
LKFYAGLCSSIVGGHPAAAQKMTGANMLTAPVLASDNEIAAVVKAWRAAGKKIVMTSGVFDIVHRGHLSVLSQARAFGDCLFGCNKFRRLGSAKKGAKATDQHTGRQNGDAGGTSRSECRGFVRRRGGAAIRTGSSFGTRRLCQIQWRVE